LHRAQGADHLFLPSPDASRTTDGQAGFDGEECGWKHIVKLAQNIVNFLIAFSVVIATLMFTYAGFLYLTAGGNPSRLEKAHKIFINVGIGFVFVLGAFLIVKLVMDTFGAS